MVKRSKIFPSRLIQRTKCSPDGSPGIPPSPRTGRKRNPGNRTYLPQVLVKESGDGVERGASRPLLVIDIDDFNIAARLAVVRDKAFGLVSGEVGIVVVIVMYDVRPALNPERRRHRHLLASLEEQHRIALGHSGFGLPIGVVLFLHTDTEGRWVGALFE